MQELSQSSERCIGVVFEFLNEVGYSIIPGLQVVVQQPVLFRREGFCPLGQSVPGLLVVALDIRHVLNGRHAAFRLNGQRPEHRRFLCPLTRTFQLHLQLIPHFLFPEVLSGLRPGGLPGDAPRNRPQVLKPRLSEVSQFLAEFLLADVPGQELAEVLAEFLVLIEEILLDFAQVFLVDLVPDEVEDFEVVLDLDDFDVGEGPAEVLPALLLAGDGAGEVHFVDVAEQHFEVVLDLLADFVAEGVVVVVAGWGREYMTPSQKMR